MKKNLNTKSSHFKAGDGRQKPRPGPEEQSRMIIDAAVALFLEQGVRSISIMQICSRAGVSRSTFYRCFEDIDNLLKYIYSVSVFEPVKHFMLISFNNPQGSNSDLKRAMEEMYEAIFARGDYAQLLFRESNDPNSPAFQIVNDVFDSIIKSLQNTMPKMESKKADAIYLKAILNAHQWIAHDAIRRGLTPANKKAAIDAAWRLVSNAMSR